MTKAELMEALKNLPDDTEIHISSDWKINGGIKCLTITQNQMFRA